MVAMKGNPTAAAVVVVVVAAAADDTVAAVEVVRPLVLLFQRYSLRCQTVVEEREDHLGYLLSLHFLECWQSCY